ncbi:MAG: hypothetical protein QM790_08375 [Nibricoccus sp.]
MGLCLGLMQTVKFGGAFPAGLVLAIADGFQFAIEKQPIDWKRWLRQLASTAGGFLLVESIFATWLFLELPLTQVRDVLWPDYMLVSYKSYVQPDVAFGTWRGASFFATSQLPVIASVVVTIAIGFRLVKQPVTPVAGTLPGWAQQGAKDHVGLAIALGLLFPLFLAVGYMPHFWAALNFLWIPLLATGACLAFSPALVRTGIILLLTASIMSATLKPLVRGTSPPAAATKTRFPNGQELYVTPEEKRTYDLVLSALARSQGRSARCLVFEASYGWAHYGGGALIAGAPEFRHHWFMTGFQSVREQVDLLRALSHVDAVLVDLRLAGPNADIHRPSTWGRSNPGFTEETTLSFFSRCEQPTQITAAVWLLKIKGK